MTDRRRPFQTTGLLARGGRPRRQINRRPSRLLARGVPWLSVMLGSVATATAWIASAPMLPPFGLLMLIAWRQLRPGLLPVWAGLPLGFIDDLYSGQPTGSAVLLWSAIMLALDAVEARFPWRSLLLEWLVAAVAIAGAILFGAMIANVAGGGTLLLLVVPQILLSALSYPLVGRFVAWLDRFRLMPFVELDEWP